MIIPFGNDHHDQIGITHHHHRNPQISDRAVRKLLVRIELEGDGGVVHRLRGKASNRRLPESLRTRAVKLVKVKYRDFGPTLACEYLAKEDGVEVSKETLRQWLMAAGLRRGRRRRIEEVHLWRPRRSCRGELVQWDTSVHDWLEGRGPRLYLVAMIDDASSQAYARFVEQDSTEENLRPWWKRRMRPLNKSGRRSGGPCGNWGLAGSRRTRRKPKVASNASSARPRTGW